MPLRYRIRQKWYGIVVGLVFSYFCIRGTEAVFIVLPYVFPDEAYHFDLSLLYSQNLGLITLADLYSIIATPVASSYVPYVYHFLMGKLLWLNIFGLESYIFLRLINLGLATGSVFVFWQLLRSLSSNQVVHVVGLIILTNIPQYSFISAGVNYDNAINLLAVCGLWGVVKLVQTKQTQYAWLVAAVSVLGPAIKISFIPMSMILLAIVGVISVRNFQHQIWNFISLRPSNLWGWSSVGVVLIGLFVNYQVYGQNYLEFGSLLPACTDLFSHQRCMRDRNYVWNQVGESYSQTIDVPPIYSYFPYWGLTMLNGVISHKGMKFVAVPKAVLVIVYLLVCFGVIAGVWRHRYFNKLDKLLGIIGMMYVLFLYLYTYLGLYVSGFTSAVNGRYLFPVVFIWVYLIAKLLVSFKPKLALPLIIFIGSLLVFSDYVYFKSQLDYTWTTAWHQKREAGEIDGHPLDYLQVETHKGEPRFLLNFPDEVKRHAVETGLLSEDQVYRE